MKNKNMSVCPVCRSEFFTIEGVLSKVGKKLCCNDACACVYDDRNTKNKSIKPGDIQPKDIYDGYSNTWNY
jgi:C4-type Zn-finger protein